MDQTILICAAKRVEARLSLRVLTILKKQKRVIEENLLGLILRHIMLVSTFSCIPCIPIKTDDPIKINHGCI